MDVSECDLTGDLQVDQDVVLKQALKVRKNKTDVLGFGVIYKLGAVLANKVLEHPDASGHISTFQAWRGCVESFGR